MVQAILMTLWQKQHTGNAFGILLTAISRDYANAELKTFGILKQERVNRKRYMTRIKAEPDISDYIKIL